MDPIMQTGVENINIKSYFFDRWINSLYKYIYIYVIYVSSFCIRSAVLVKVYEENPALHRYKL